MVKIECQTFVYYHVYLLWNIKFTGYIAIHFDTHKFTFAWQKSTFYELNKTNFDIDKTFRVLKIIAWLFSSYHIEKQFNVYYTLPVKSNWKVCKFIEIEICFWICVILQLSGRNQFPTCNTNFVSLAMHLECLFSESRYFQIW